MNQMLPTPAVPGRGIALWVVYDHPADHPFHVVARLWHGEQPTDRVLVGDDLDTVRALVRGQPGVLGVDLSRQPDDDPCIVEVWL